MPATTIAFDVYGTLIDTHGVVVALERHVGERAEFFSRLWRDKQLEYSFRRGLMQNYADFAVCTADALAYTAQSLGVELDEEARGALMGAYRVLPAFPDVTDGLAAARDAGLRLYAFSNGSAEAVAGLLEHAGIAGFFEDVVSVEELRSFKPNPAVYAHFLRRAGCTGGEAWLVSSNPFDVIGAISAGLRAAWVRRAPGTPYDPWGIEPTATVAAAS